MLTGLTVLTMLTMIYLFENTASDRAQANRYSSFEESAYLNLLAGLGNVQQFSDGSPFLPV